MNYKIKSDWQLDDLIQQCSCEKHEIQKDGSGFYSWPQPYWDGLAPEWLFDELPNGFIREEFRIFCRLEDKSTYALFEQHGGFFRQGEPQEQQIFAGGFSFDGDSFQTEKPEEHKISICGYKWDSDGNSYTYDNTDQIPDGCNEGWCDCDDWLYGPFYFEDFDRWGREIKPCPPGYCRSWETDEDGNRYPGCRPFPKKLNIERRLFDLGGKKAGSDIDSLEQLYNEPSEPDEDKPRRPRRPGT